MRTQNGEFYRVIPRDLFNEAKLLKSLGRLCLLIHEGLADPLEVDLEDPETGFQVELSPTYGTLFVSNLHIWPRHATASFFTHYNDKAPWPLWVTVSVDDRETTVEVFTEDGELTQEFRAGVLEVATDEPN